MYNKLLLKLFYLLSVAIPISILFSFDPNNEFSPLGVVFSSIFGAFFVYVCFYILGLFKASDEIKIMYIVIWLIFGIMSIVDSHPEADNTFFTAFLTGGVVSLILTGILVGIKYSFKPALKCSVCGAKSSDHEVIEEEKWSEFRHVTATGQADKRYKNNPLRQIIKRNYKCKSCGKLFTHTFR